MCSRSLNSNSSSKRAAISSLCHLFYSVIYLKVLNYPFSEFNSSVLKEIDHEVPWWQTQSDLFGLPKNTIWEQMQSVKWKGKKKRSKYVYGAFYPITQSATWSRRLRGPNGTSASFIYNAICVFGNDNGSKWQKTFQSSEAREAERHHRTGDNDNALNGRTRRWKRGRER